MRREIAIAREKRSPAGCRLVSCLPAGLAELGYVQTAIPRSAKDARATREIETAVRRIPTVHHLYRGDAREPWRLGDESIHPEQFPLMCSGVSASWEESAAGVGRDRVSGVAHRLHQLTLRSGGGGT